MHRDAAASSADFDEAVGDKNAAALASRQNAQTPVHFLGGRSLEKKRERLGHAPALACYIDLRAESDIDIPLALDDRGQASFCSAFSVSNSSCVHIAHEEPSTGLAGSSQPYLRDLNAYEGFQARIPTGRTASSVMAGLDGGKFSRAAQVASAGAARRCSRNQSGRRARGRGRPRLGFQRVAGEATGRDHRQPHPSLHAAGSDTVVVNPN